MFPSDMFVHAMQHIRDGLNHHHICVRKDDLIFVRVEINERKFSVVALDAVNFDVLNVVAGQPEISIQNTRGIRHLQILSCVILYRRKKLIP
jgi:hypothetical protein